MSSLHHTLLRLAERFGIEPGYWDIAGAYHETSDELRRAILASLGYECETEQQALDQWERLEREKSGHWLPAVVVACRGEEIPVQLPDGWSGPVCVDVDLEDGTRLSFQSKIVPEDMPTGYHKATVTAHETASCELMVCPHRVWLPEALERGGRRAGLAVSLYGVGSSKTWGCGDFTALRGLLDWVARETGGSYVALNPLHAIHNRHPFNTSPYLPNSLLYRNFLYLDLDSIEEMSSCPAADSLRRHHSTLAEIERLRGCEYIDYEGVAALKLRFLRLLHDYFRRVHLRVGTPRGGAFETWIRREGEPLRLYALYMALEEYFHSQDANTWNWLEWPEDYRDPESMPVRQFAEAHQDEILFHQYVQWQLDEQARGAQEYAVSLGMEIGLFHDLPLATDRCGVELWANRRLYVAGCRVGSPPDSFSPNGQDWSFPPPNRLAHLADGYRHFRQTIRHSARHGAALRIDHVMRLFRLYWIPDGRDARQGAYVRDFAGDLLRILALESHRNRILIVGEDLGTVEPWMREELASFGILSYRVFYFERKPGGEFQSASEYPRQALVSSTTHDLPTLAGFWSGRDLEARHTLGLLGGAENQREWLAGRTSDKLRIIELLKREQLLPPDFPEPGAHSPELSGEIHNAITGFLASTPSMLMTLNQEDLTKELDQQNLPGTTSEYPNWRRRMLYTVEELRDDPMAKAYTSMLRNWLEKSGRVHAAPLKESG